MQMCSCFTFLNLWLSQYLMALILEKSRSRNFPHNHTFLLHLEIKLGITINHRHPLKLKILNLILLSIPLDRYTHLTLRSAYDLYV